MRIILMLLIILVLENNHYSQNIYKEALKDIKLYPKLRTFMKLSKTMFEDGRTWGVLPSLYEKCDNYIRKALFLCSRLRLLIMILINSLSLMNTENLRLSFG